MFLYLTIAEVIWPIFVPIAVILIEPDERRQHLMLLCLAAGVSVGAYLFWYIVVRPHGAVIIDDHIVYVTEQQQSGVVGIAYLAATTFPLLLSSRRTMNALGVIVLAGSVTAYAFYWEAFVSVWCFFAATASVAIMGHFEWSHRQRLAIAGA